MIIYDKAMLDNYLQNDWIAMMIENNMVAGEDSIRTNQWLREMDNKRMIYADMYGDLLVKQTGKRVLDVGGGYNSLTKVLAKNSEYYLCDFMAHGGEL